jgi:hypothetical protein
MDCRQFRKQHSYFIDDMLSGVETWAMRDHVGTCASCSRFDTHLRRSLLVARQAHTLEPSRDFERKLSARLAAEKLARPAFREMNTQSGTRRVPVIAAAAALVMGLLGAGMFSATSDEPVTVGVAVAERVPAIALPLAPKAQSETAASVQPVHPAMLLAQRATEQFAASQARAAAGTRATH